MATEAQAGNDECCEEAFFNGEAFFNDERNFFTVAPHETTNDHCAGDSEPGASAVESLVVP
jgi:hypothetical protein